MSLTREGAHAGAHSATEGRNISTWTRDLRKESTDRRKSTKGGRELHLDEVARVEVELVHLFVGRAREHHVRLGRLGVQRGAVEDGAAADRLDDLHGGGGARVVRIRGGGGVGLATCMARAPAALQCNTPGRHGCEHGVVAHVASAASPKWGKQLNAPRPPPRPTTWWRDQTEQTQHPFEKVRWAGQGEGRALPVSVSQRCICLS